MVYESDRKFKDIDDSDVDPDYVTTDKSDEEIEGEQILKTIMENNDEEHTAQFFIGRWGKQPPAATSVKS